MRFGKVAEREKVAMKGVKEGKRRKFLTIGSKNGGRWVLGGGKNRAALKSTL